LSKFLHLYLQGRQKLARFNAIEFATLIVDLLHDAKNREGLNTENQSAGMLKTNWILKNTTWKHHRNAR